MGTVCDKGVYSSTHIFTKGRPEYQDACSTIDSTLQIVRWAAEDPPPAGVTPHPPQVDRRMEDALRGAVRRSLAELARLLAGDKRAEMAPLFTVALALERTNRIELRPTVQAHLNWPLASLAAWAPPCHQVQADLSSCS